MKQSRLDRICNLKALVRTFNQENSEAASEPRLPRKAAQLRVRAKLIFLLSGKKIESDAYLLDNITYGVCSGPSRFKQDGDDAGLFAFQQRTTL